MEWEVIVKAIQEEIEKIREKYVIQNKIIRDDVFGILEDYCTVLYYPTQEEKNCGFHIKKIVKDELEDFVYINTAKTLEVQVFTAAHELGHIWCVAEIVWNRIGTGEALQPKLEEDITNRFAAELLMPKDIFKETFMEYVKDVNVENSSIKEDDLIRIIVMQMNDFMVPFDAVRKRLYETNIIGQNVKKHLKEHQKGIIEKIQIYSKDQNSRLESETMRKTIPGLRGLIEKAELEQKWDQNSLEKIKKDFDIQYVNTGSHTLKIRIGENTNGEDGSNS